MGSSSWKLASFSWVVLRTTPHWEEIEKALEFVRRVTPSFDIEDNTLYDEFVCIKQ
jgi:hypothetical protein